MCKFHKDVAVQIATGPDGITDPLRYSIMTCALWRFWIDLYMPEMSYLDGYSPYEMSTSKVVAALEQCDRLQELKRDVPALSRYAEDHAPHLRQAVDSIIAERNLTLKSLNLPKDPLKNRDGVGAIAEGIYEGFPSRGLNVRIRAVEPKQEPMREVIEALFSQKEFNDVLEKMIAGSFVRLMTQAQETTDPKLVRAYERLPYGVRTAFLSCAMHGGGATLGTHVLCLAMPAAIGALGMAASPVIAAGVDRTLEWRQGNPFSWKRSASVAAISFAVAAGINAGWPHDHFNTDKARDLAAQSQDKRDALIMAERQRYLKLPADLRSRIDQKAAEKAVSPEVYLSICDGSDSLGRDIAAFETNEKSKSAESLTSRVLKSLNL